MKVVRGGVDSGSGGDEVGVGEMLENWLAYAGLIGTPNV